MVISSYNIGGIVYVWKWSEFNGTIWCEFQTGHYGEKLHIGQWGSRLPAGEIYGTFTIVWRYRELIQKSCSLSKVCFNVEMILVFSLCHLCARQTRQPPWPKTLQFVFILKNMKNHLSKVQYILRNSNFLYFQFQNKQFHSKYYSFIVGIKLW